MQTDWITHRTQAYRIEKTVPGDKTLVLVLEGLPFSTGDTVEILIMRPQPRREGNRYPLRGTPVEYHAPFESVAENDWETLQ